MSNGHVDSEVLARFARGEVGPDLAVSIALHIDECPLCAGMAHGMDPLADAFASADDPAMPPDLVGCVIAADRMDVSVSLGREPWVAALLLVGAAVVLGLGSSPADLMVEAWMMGKALGATVGALAGSTSISWPLASLAAACALVASVTTSHVVSRKAAA